MSRLNHHKIVEVGVAEWKPYLALGSKLEETTVTAAEFNNRLITQMRRRMHEEKLVSTNRAVKILRPITGEIAGQGYFPP